MEAQMEIQGAAKPLNDHHRPAAPVGHAVPGSPLLQRPHDDSREDAGHRATERVIPRQSIPQTERHGQHPLPDRYIGQDPIDQVGGPFRHSAPAATRAEATPLARKGHEPVVAAAGASESGKPARQPAAAQDGPELRFDEPGQPRAVAEGCRVRPERLEVIAHRAIDDIVLWTTRLIVERGATHTRVRAHAVPAHASAVPAEVPAPRIVSDELWQGVKARQGEMRKTLSSGAALVLARGPTYLFTGLTKCGVCGAGFTMFSKNRMACAGSHNRGTCDNGLTIRRDEVEARVLIRRWTPTCGSR